MDWKDVGNLVAEGAPLLGGLLGGPIGGAAGAIVASIFGTEAEPDKVAEAIKADPQAMVKLRQAEMDHAAELRRMTLEAETARLAEVNATMRAEAAAEDPYVRRWRPTIGYIVAFQLGLLGLAVFAVAGGAIVATFTGDAAQVTSLFDGLAKLITALTAILAIELTVLGVNITKRSQDKQVRHGQTPEPGVLQSIAKRIAGG